MKRFFLFLFVLITVTSCDEVHPFPAVQEETEEAATAQISTVNLLQTSLSHLENTRYVWTLVDTAGLSSCYWKGTDNGELFFVPATPGQYVFNQLIIEGNGSQKAVNMTVSVPPPASPLWPYIKKVYDFKPAPGQFINKLPEMEPGQTKAHLLRACEGYLCHEPSENGLVSLGSFGGYIVFGFDHGVVNVPGKRDFTVLGNAFFSNQGYGRGGSCEPGVICVSYDANGNGLPDDAWYEIAGHSHNDAKTIHNYSITYRRYAGDDEPVGDFEPYISWEDNQGQQGFVPKNRFHSQSYYPYWIQQDTITFRGTRLPNNGKDESGQGTYWVLYDLGRGYCDNAPNTDEDAKIDIAWAVDHHGRSVDLPMIHFVKVYTGLLQVCGWLGETSTEVAGAIDLHL